MCVVVLPACMSVNRVLPGCPLRPEEGARGPGTGLRADCERLRGSWELKPDSL